MTPKILFVDDEPKVLSGFERLFRREFSVDTAGGGEEALMKIASSGPYPIIISDMRMPGMNGSELLARARAIAPDSIRMVLTGETDVNSAVQAVNDGAIFRFLLKPCSEPVLRAAIVAGLRQYDLQNVERNLLENTLNGSIRMLTEILGLVNPGAFGRSTRVRRYVHHIVTTLNLADAWQFEIAAMLSQVGCVTVDPVTLEAAQAGQRLGEEEQRRFLTHPSVAHKLLMQVPRLEPVAAMILRQNEAFSAAASKDAAALGAQILHACLDFDALIARGQDSKSALDRCAARAGEYNPEILEALSKFRFGTKTYQPAVMPVAHLETGMIVDEDVRTSAGLLLVGRGQETTFPMLVRLQNFRRSNAIPANIRVLVLRPGVEAEEQPLPVAAA